MLDTVREKTELAELLDLAIRYLDNARTALRYDNLDTCVYFLAGGLRIGMGAWGQFQPTPEQTTAMVGEIRR